MGNIFHLDVHLSVVFVSALSRWEGAFQISILVVANHESLQVIQVFFGLVLGENNQAPRNTHASKQ